MANQPEAFDGGMTVDLGTEINAEIQVVAPQLPAPEQNAGIAHEQRQADLNTKITMAYREHTRPMLAYLLRRTHGDWETAEDLLQDTMTRYSRALAAGRVDEGSSIRPLLFTIARNLHVDALRVPKFKLPQVAEFLRQDEQVASEDGYDAVEAKLLIDAALDQLSPEHRIVLTMVHLQGYASKDVAEILGISPGTVKSRMHYGLRAARTILEDMGITGEDVFGS